MPKKPIPGAPLPEAWKPPDYEIADAAAIQALTRGDASADQQRRALAWIINNAARTYDQSWRPDLFGGARATDFAEGRRSVGLALVKLANLKLSTLTGKPSEQG